MNRTLTITALCGLALSACRGEVSTDPPIQILRNMHYQQRYNPQATSHFFADGRTMRNPPLGTVPRFPGGANARYVGGSIGRDEEFDDDRVVLGHEPDRPDYVSTIPASVIERAGDMQHLAERGQARYAIYCTPCHGPAGDGTGIVWRRAQETRGYNYPQPASLHQARLQHAPDGQIYATIANGVRNMPGYSAQIPVQDRWAIVAYVRALQISQAATATAPTANANGATP